MKIFETFMKTYFASIPIPITTTSFSDDELNALRYVCAWVCTIQVGQKE